MNLNYENWVWAVAIIRAQFASLPPPLLISWTWIPATAPTPHHCSGCCSAHTGDSGSWLPWESSLTAVRQLNNVSFFSYFASILLILFKKGRRQNASGCRWPNLVPMCTHRPIMSLDKVLTANDHNTTSHLQLRISCISLWISVDISVDISAPLTSQLHW